MIYWNQSIMTEQCVVLLLLDLSAPFDTVDQKILLYRLRSRFGIKGKALAWLQSYLSTDRSQSVQIDLLPQCSSYAQIWCTPGIRVGAFISLIHDPTGWHNTMAYMIWNSFYMLMILNCTLNLQLWWYVDLTTIQFPGLRAALSISLTGWLLTNRS